MNTGRTIIKMIGLVFIALSGWVFILSWVACILIQPGFLGDIPDIFGGIAYFGGPLPIIPAVLGSIGVLFLGTYSLVCWLRKPPAKKPAA